MKSRGRKNSCSSRPNSSNNSKLRWIRCKRRSRQQRKCSSVQRKKSKNSYYWSITTLELTLRATPSTNWTKSLRKLWKGHQPPERRQWPRLPPKVQGLVPWIRLLRSTGTPGECPKDRIERVSAILTLISCMFKFLLIGVTSKYYKFAFSQYDYHY